VKEKTESAGGAGNIVSNLLGLGCSVTLVSVCGDDEAGEKLFDILNHEKIALKILKDTKRPTIVKTRAMAKNQQLLRLDEEMPFPLSQNLKNKIIDIVKEESLENDAIIFSDYGKGVLLDKNICQEIIKFSKIKNKIIMVDPKGRDWDRYNGATCVTPNTSEFELVCGESIGDNNHLFNAMKEIIKKYDLSKLVVTRGSKGMAAMEKSSDGFLIPTMAKEVYDVSGAGDTVIATLTTAYAAGFPFIEAVKLANIAAGIVVGKIGTQPITRLELETAIKLNGFKTCASFSSKITSLTAAEALVRAWKSANYKIVFTNGCFDLLHPGHIYLLNSAKALGDKLVVGLNSDLSVRRLKGPTRPILDEKARAALLGSLETVDLVIIFDDDMPENLIRILKPDILVKGNDYKMDEVVGKEIVESYGGKIHLIPILKGYSTKKITQFVLNSNEKQNIF